MVSGSFRVVDYSDTTQRTGAFNIPNSFKPVAPCDFVNVDLCTVLTEINVGALTDSGLLAAINYIQVSVGGTVLYTIDGIRENDFATGHGMLGEINRQLFGQSVYQEGDAAVAQNTSENRTCSFKLPIFQPDAVGKEIKVDIYFRQATDWTAGAGTARVDGMNVIIEAHYSGSCPKAKYQLVEDANVGASIVDRMLKLDDMNGWYIIFGCATLVQAGAYEHFMTRLKLVDTNGVPYADLNARAMIKHITDQAGLFVQYAAAKTFAERNEGVFLEPVDSVECVAMKWAVSTNATAAAATVRIFTMLTSEGPQKEQTPRQKESTSHVDQSGAASGSTGGGTSKPLVTLVRKS